MPWGASCSQWSGTFQQRLAARLIEAGVLGEMHHKALGLTPTTRLPELDHLTGAQARDRLRAVLIGERPPSEDDDILAGVIGALDLVGVVVADRGQLEEAKRRAKGLGESGDR